MAREEKREREVRSDFGIDAAKMGMNSTNVSSLSRSGVQIQLLEIRNGELRIFLLGSNMGASESCANSFLELLGSSTPISITQWRATINLAESHCVMQVLNDSSAKILRCGPLPRPLRVVSSGSLDVAVSDPRVAVLPVAYRRGTASPSLRESTAEAFQIALDGLDRRRVALRLPNFLPSLGTGVTDRCGATGRLYVTHPSLLLGLLATQFGTNAVSLIPSAPTFSGGQTHNSANARAHANTVMTSSLRGMVKKCGIVGQTFKALK